MFIRSFIALVAVLGIALPALAKEDGNTSTPPTEDLPPPTVTFVPDEPQVATATQPVVSQRQRFIESNVIETLYHELGHAVIDILELPVFGPEEFAADTFSVILMNRLHDENNAIRLAYDAAAAYSTDAERDAARGYELAEWDVHGTGRQRYFNLVCLFYGAKPDEREDLALELGLPEARAATCEDEFELANRSWSGVLDKLAQDAPGTSIQMDWVLREDTHLVQFVKAEVARLNNAIVLPEKLVVSVIPCGEVNAFYDPGPKEIIFCTEFAAHLGRLAD